MKIFAVYARLNLTKKPEWLDDFRAKYDELYDFHVTLKQPCFIDENQIIELKKILAKLFSESIVENHKLDIVFDRIVFEGVESKGMYVMIQATNIDEISQLQNRVKSALSLYKSYVKPEFEEYENNFKPHITIGRKLNSEMFLQAKTYFKENYVCNGTIEEIVLAIVPEDTVEESKKPENLTVYGL